MRIHGTLLLLWAASGLPATAGAAEPAEAQHALLQAVAEAPLLKAAAHRADAAQARVASSGRLPDPEVEGMASRMNGPMGERATMYELNVRQPLPRRGERAADRERAAAGVSMAQADYALMAGELAADTAMALAEGEAATERIRLLTTQVGRLQAVLRAMEIRLGAGSDVRLADRLTVETRLASMTVMIEQERTMAEDALAAARGRLGLPPGAPLPPFAVPSVDDVAEVDAASIRLASARADEATAMAKMARAGARPMTAVGLRLERERTAMGDEDIVGVAFMSEIPWRSRQYAAAEARAAEADRSAAEAEGQSAQFRIRSTLTRVERAQRLAETAHRLGSETLTRLETEYDTLVRTAGVGGTGDSTVLQLVELLEQATDTRLQLIQADLTVRIARAELWRYVPADRFFHPSIPVSP